jgi:Mg/Co/Ni transporter MgtE
VLGRLGRRALASVEDVAVEAAMTSGPSTVRPSITLEAIAERTQRQKLTSALVTRSDGTLVGLLRRADAEAASARRPLSRRRRLKGREGR